MRRRKFKVLKAKGGKDASQADFGGNTPGPGDTGGEGGFGKDTRQFGNVGSSPTRTLQNVGTKVANNIGQFSILPVTPFGMTVTALKTIENQRRAKKTIDRYMSTHDFKNNYNLDFITTSLVDFNYKEYTEVVDTVVTDVPEPWEFFENNIVTKDLKWVSYLPSISQITKFNEVLINNKFENIEVKEVILRDWVVDKKIVRPSNKLVSHTGFIISGRYIKY